MNPKISIIIPAHNEENYISKTLHSIKKQNFQDYETIIVTNGCTDKTEEVIKKSKLPFMHLKLAKANVSRARNYGAGKSKGEILLFLDADTLLEENTLEKINQDFTSQYSIGTTKASPDLLKLQFRLAILSKNVYNSTGLYKGCSGALICRREDFDQVNGYNPEIIVKEHRELTSKLLKLGKYKCVNTKVTTSMRRYKSWGLAKVSYFWVKEWVKKIFWNLKESDYEKVR